MLPGQCFFLATFSLSLLTLCSVATSTRYINTTKLYRLLVLLQSYLLPKKSHNMEHSSPAEHETPDENAESLKRMHDHDSADQSSDERPSKRARIGPPSEQESNKEASNTDQESNLVSGDEEDERLIACLKFSSANGKAAYADCLSKISTQEEYTDRAGYNLRRRGRSGHQKTAVIESARLASDYDERAKPFARGCRECVSHAERCSLLDHEKHWPCDWCRETNNDCDLITRPIRRITCKSCKRRRKICSYTNTRNHDGPCVQCASVGLHCVAGPVKEFIRPRIRYPAEGEEVVAPKKSKKARPQDDCIECVQAKRKCSYPAEYDGGACDDCRRLNLLCTISDTSVASQPGAAPDRVGGHASTNETTVPRDASDCSPSEKDQKDSAGGTMQHQNQPTAKKATNPTPTKDENPSTTQNPTHQRPDTAFNPPKPTNHHPPSSSSSTSASTPKATLLTLPTSFRHPITFNCDLPSPSPSQLQQPCHFCTNPTLSIFGFGKLHPTVLLLPPSPKTPSNSYIKELHSGHAAAGIEPTRLCTACTTHRMSIQTCPSHKFRSSPSPNPPPSAAENRTVSLALLDGHITTPAQLSGYCSLCSNLASYKCRSKCGLQVCGFCREGLGRAGGELEKFLKQTPEGESEERVLGLRADVEFLRRDGPLMRWVKWRIEKGEI